MAGFSARIPASGTNPALAAAITGNTPLRHETGQTVKAIILSAGQGKRLLPLTERAPKCMLPVAGQPLVARQIDALLACGVEDVTVVVGFGAELVETGLAQRYGARRIRTLYNPFYTITDNLVSCWVARGEMEHEFLILNGDTLFAAVVLERLLAAPERPITLAVSRKDGYDDDDMKVIRDGERLLRVGKKLPREEVNAESIGMMTFRGEGPRLFREAMDAALRNPAALSQWYLSLIDALAKNGVVFTQEIPAAAWAEVDSPADLERASTPGAAWLSCA
jgi:choline kinase